jgi:hypothetical protein
MFPVASDATRSRSTPLRLLSIDPYYRGFGFALFENTNLVDWGTLTVGDGSKVDTCARRLRRLIDRYNPDRLILEDIRGSDSRRSIQTKQLLEDLKAVAGARGTTVSLLRWRTVQRFWSDQPRPTKFDIACELAKHLPELEQRLPPKRRPWDSQDSRLSIFNASALVLTYIFVRLCRTRSTKT